MKAYLSVGGSENKLAWVVDLEWTVHLQNFMHMQQGTNQSNTALCSNVKYCILYIYSLKNAKIGSGTYLHIGLRLRMSGIIPLLPINPYLAWTGTTLPHIYIYIYIYIYTCVCVCVCVCV
jgi:hypothetical protein